MKKIISLLTAVSLVFSLAACGTEKADTEPNGASTGTNTPQSNDAENSSKTESTAPDAEPSADANQSSNFKTFGANHQSLVNAIRSSAESDYPDLLSAEPSVSTQEATDILPEAKVYSYQVCPGAQLLFSTVASSEELYQVFYVIETSKVSDADFNGKVGFLTGLLESALEPDYDTRMKIDQELNLSNSAVTSASGSIADFSYIVEDGTLMLNITAKS